VPHSDNPRIARSFLFTAIALACAPAAWCVTYYLATDVPATLGGTDFTADEVLLNAGGLYSLQLAFGEPSVQLGGLERRADGLWLLTPAKPEEGAGPRDVVLFDGVTLTPYFDGATAGVPEYARIDSVMLDPGGALVLSFDVPVNLGGAEYGPSDLVRYNLGVFSLFWNSGAAGVPPDSNVVGAGETAAGDLIVTFDVPTRLGATEFMPGQLVRWDGGTNFSAYVTDPSWPPDAQLRDFGFLPPSGAVSDGQLPGVPLTISRSASNLTLSWGATCVAGDTDYEVYEGTLGLFYSHTSKLCSTGGATNITFSEPSGSVYYLVVPRNAVCEGSYGRKSDNTELPQGASACLPQQVAAQCP